jgi:hypothetical protein
MLSGQAIAGMTLTAVLHGVSFRGQFVWDVTLGARASGSERSKEAIQEAFCSDCLA